MRSAPIRRSTRARDLAPERNGRQAHPSRMTRLAARPLPEHHAPRRRGPAVEKPFHIAGPPSTRRRVMPASARLSSTSGERQTVPSSRPVEDMRAGRLVGLDFTCVRAEPGEEPDRHFARGLEELGRQAADRATAPRPRAPATALPGPAAGTCRSGSSSRTVPEPTRMASASARIRWPAARASAPVTNFGAATLAARNVALGRERHLELHERPLLRHAQDVPARHPVRLVR